MKKRYLIIPIITLFLASNVYAITSNEVTYDNEGKTENLTDTLDTLYSELKEYKTGGSVASNQMLEGATGYSKGVLVTGTIKSKGAETITPGTSNKTIAAGQYLSGIQTIAGDADLKAENILSGVDIFGVKGTHDGRNHSVGLVYTGAYARWGNKAVCVFSNSWSASVNGKLFVYYGGSSTSSNMSGEWTHSLVINGTTQSPSYSWTGGDWGEERYVVNVKVGDSVIFKNIVNGSSSNLTVSCPTVAMVFS